jgi:multisubunit Na+/H+ antiporter MnhB subunit
MDVAGTGIIDLVLGMLMVLLAGASLLHKQLFRSVMAFIGFGLVVAVAWARLGAVDIALVEAMIGSGITGALFLAALSRMARHEEKKSVGPDAPAAGAASGSLGDESRASRKTIRLRRVTAAAVIAVAVALVFVNVFPLPAPNGRIPDLVSRNLSHSGVSNPVTAVLLNFRAYDTLLEIGVVLLALLGLRAVGGLCQSERQSHPEIVLAGFYRLLLPVLILFSAYMVWVGADDPGGAFQAAALLAAGGIIGWMTDADPLAHGLRETSLRIVVSAGFAFFLSLGVLFWIQSGVFLKFAPVTAGRWIVAIEVLATISIALSLIILFLGSSGYSPSPRGIGSLPADREGG